MNILRLTQRRRGEADGGARELTRRAKLLWTAGNALMLFGVILLSYVAGLSVQAEYGRLAARGDSDLPVPRAVTYLGVDTLPVSGAEPAPFIAPTAGPAPTQQRAGAIADGAGGVEPSFAAPRAPTPLAEQPASVTRVVIPSIDVDSKVVEVGWETVTSDAGKPVSVWQVAEYAVGQHRGSANPGAGGNIVLAGHVGGYGKVFKDLVKVKAGDLITLSSDGRDYVYRVDERLIVKEEGVAPEQHAENARYIAPTTREVVTLVTCWPARGPDRFQYRIIVRASPLASATNGQ